jgi:hypothetical protein
MYDNNIYIIVLTVLYIHYIILIYITTYISVQQSRHFGYKLLAECKKIMNIKTSKFQTMLEV